MQRLSKLITYANLLLSVARSVVARDVEAISESCDAASRALQQVTISSNEDSSEMLEIIRSIIRCQRLKQQDV